MVILCTQLGGQFVIVEQLLTGAERALIGQALGGILFVLIAGQPLVIIGTTALVSLYIKGETFKLTKLTIIDGLFGLF